MSGTITSLYDRWGRRPPAAGAAVMATGIVSVGLDLTGYDTLSLIALATASLAWALLAADFTARLLWDRKRWLAEAGTPGALTAVAATAVLGTRFSAMGRHTLAGALLALAVLWWPVLLVDVVRHRRDRMPGSVFLCTVATQALAALGATLARAQGLAWLAHAALVVFWLGLGLYAFALAHFDFREIATGAGDHWVAAGGLSTSALAGANLLSADDTGLRLWNADDTGVLRTVTAALLVLALCWYAVLLAAEAAWPRPRYDVRRWATVFPMGMMAVAASSAATAADLPWARRSEHGLLWVAVAVWTAVAVGAVASALGAIRSTAPR
ncbi:MULTISPECIES: hypothetical protein [unclassified Streptomyces]|uniref:SLAC1 family transporter n=1 Tax=unclassified Streptomyces TaxID=2593676 RepID=UPI003D71508F